MWSKYELQMLGCADGCSQMVVRKLWFTDAVGCWMADIGATPGIGLDVLLLALPACFIQTLSVRIRQSSTAAVTTKLDQEIRNLGDLSEPHLHRLKARGHHVPVKQCRTACGPGPCARRPHARSSLAETLAPRSLRVLIGVHLGYFVHGTDVQSSLRRPTQPAGVYRTPDM